VDSAARATGSFEELSRSLERRDFSGWDPYDALSSRGLRTLARGRLLRQAAIQGVKALPVNPRRFLGIPAQQHTKGLALCLSAYARLARLEGGEAYVGFVEQLAERLLARSVRIGTGTGWAYDFDVQTRWGYYRAGTPNAVVTAFTAHALLDAYELLEDERLHSAARSSLGFARESLLTEADGSAFFAYYPGSRVPIHNASLLLASVFARCGETDGSTALEFSLQRRRPDGLWPYGEGRGLGWVDGYHTAFIIWVLGRWPEQLGPPELHAASSAALEQFLARLVDPDGAARATLDSRYPIDIHACASAAWCLSEVPGVDADRLGHAGRILGWTLDNMQRDDAGFAFQRTRLYRNAVPYFRWSDAHMLLALAAFVRAARALGSV
jgi:hypothetical protein